MKSDKIQVPSGVPSVFGLHSSDFSENLKSITKPKSQSQKKIKDIIYSVTFKNVVTPGHHIERNCKKMDLVIKASIRNVVN